jgi:hypothetical protein
MTLLDGAQEQILTMREAAELCGLSERTIGRKLRAGALPGAYKVVGADRRGQSVWRIPVADLHGAGLVETTAGHDAVVPTHAPETVAEAGLELVGTDRFGRLRSELAEAVAAAELSLVRAEIAKWRAVAEERGRSLARADLVLETVASVRSRAVPAPPVAPAERSAAPIESHKPQARPAPGAAEIPEHVLEEARRWAQASPAMRELRASRRWRKRRS